MRPYIQRAGSLLVLIHALAAQGTAQRILDWPLRTSAGAEAVIQGAEAAFWNPAAISTGGGRGEVLIADQRAPDVIGIGGFALAGSWRLDARTIVGAGYQHVSIDDIGETSTSPLPDAGDPSFAISEDQISIGVSHALGVAVTAGALVRYDRSDEIGFFESATSLGAGVLLKWNGRLAPKIGATIITQSGGVRYVGGLEAGATVRGDVGLRAGYGIRGGERTVATEHRLGVTGDWRQVIAITGGVTTAHAGSERSWEPVFGASLRISRYELGVLRETLANEFGAAYSFRFRLGLK